MYIGMRVGNFLNRFGDNADMLRCTFFQGYLFVNEPNVPPMHAHTGVSA